MFLLLETGERFNRGGGGEYPQSSILCHLLFLLIFSSTEKTQVIYLNDKVGGGIQFVSHCAAQCLSKVYCGQTRKGGCTSPGKKKGTFSE